jgi:hypothetical protein
MKILLLNNINQFVSVMEMQCAFCEVGVEFLSII